MIYNTYKNFLFVHIPRTGGISITDSLLTSFPDSIVDTINQRHRYAMGCRSIDRLEEIWSRLYKFTVIRNPWEIIESDFRLICRDIRAMHTHTKMEVSDSWFNKLKRISKCKSFSEFVIREYLGRSIVWEGGFWRTWCCDSDGNDLGIKVFCYEDLDDMWSEIRKELKISSKLEHMNSSDKLYFGTKYANKVLRQLGSEPVMLSPIKIELLFPCEWTIAAKDAIGELCCIDVEKFGYEFQGQLTS